MSTAGITAVPTTGTSTADLIQPDGCLLSIEISSRRVVRVSANIEAILGIAPAELLGQVPTHKRIVGLLDSLIHQPASSKTLIREFSLRTAGVRRNFHASCWRNDLTVTIEIERVERLRHRHILAATTHWLSDISEAENSSAVLSVLADGIRELTHQQRVMVYEFDEQSNALVAAESNEFGSTDFLGRHFSAEFLPPNLDQFYNKQGLRTITDVNATLVPLLAWEGEGGELPVDFNRSVLQAAPQRHLTLMQSMGLRTALNFAIHGTDDQKGVISCQSAQLSPVSPTERYAALTLVKMSSQRLQLLASRAQARFTQRVINNRHLLTERPGQMFDPEELLEEYGDQWLQLLSACGLALVHDKEAARHGHTPDAEVLLNLKRRLTVIHQQRTPWSTTCLLQTRLQEAGDFGECCGLLALPMHSLSPTGWLFFFRRETLQEKDWVVPSRNENNALNVKLLPQSRGLLTLQTEVLRHHSLPWQELEQAAAADLAEDFSVAIAAHQIEQLNELLQKANNNLASLARTDSLTGLFNRYHMEEQVAQELVAGERYQRPCSLILFDVDHFKQFNDTHGHEAGDKVLKQVAQTARGCLRENDQIARWGGEEFLVLAANTDLRGAHHLAERIRLAIAALDFGKLGKVTVSLGVAEWQQGNTVKTLVAKADAAMYEAKHSGRNRTVIEAE